MAEQNIDGSQSPPGAWDSAMGLLRMKLDMGSEEATALVFPGPHGSTCCLLPRREKSTHAWPRSCASASVPSPCSKECIRTKPPSAWE
eukprot:CAMPEP_0172796252 /NCGR_PEP_ID=MMETSP1074-20121228/210893_1 /TAXON_ID=2916 /ORGANISM="Ceratium fusus, Strain PA161109" /LENGTH=87 /DNA_ID=CAMNT_0013633345 /DNA_START=1607 /DNA_END=1870 /DNA_ORIENTATION=-